MLNCEKYAEQIAQLGFAIDKHAENVKLCECFGCDECIFNNKGECAESRLRWLLDDSEAVHADQLEVDDIIWVSQDKKRWSARYFALYQGNLFYCWKDGASSLTVGDLGRKEGWKFAMKHNGKKTL